MNGAIVTNQIKANAGSNELVCLLPLLYGCWIDRVWLVSTGPQLSMSDENADPLAGAWAQTVLQAASLRGH